MQLTCSYNISNKELPWLLVLHQQVILVKHAKLCKTLYRYICCIHLFRYRIKILPFTLQHVMDISKFVSCCSNSVPIFMEKTRQVVKNLWLEWSNVLCVTVAFLSYFFENACAHHHQHDLVQFMSSNLSLVCNKKYEMFSRIIFQTIENEVNVWHTNPGKCCSTHTKYFNFFHEPSSLDCLKYFVWVIFSLICTSDIQLVLIKCSCLYNCTNRSISVNLSTGTVFHKPSFHYRNNKLPFTRQHVMDTTKCVTS